MNFLYLLTKAYDTQLTKWSSQYMCTEKCLCKNEAQMILYDEALLNMFGRTKNPSSKYLANNTYTIIAQEKDGFSNFE